MTKKKARSMAGLPWIAAMAFFMQALDATILNTALPAIAQSLNRSPLAMQSAIISYTLTVAMLILPLFVLGMAMSTQFTSMNTITLADLTDENASSGNSVLAVTQQLSISLGVAVSAAVLRFYEGFDSANTVEQFHYTFITMGALTVVSALVFMLLKPKDGRNLIKERHKEKAKPNRVPSEQE